MSDEQRQPHGGSVPGPPAPPRIPSITGYDPAPLPPPAPLAVPERKGMPRWAVAVIASAVVLAMLMLCGVPAWLFVSGVRDAIRSEQQTQPPSGESASGEGIVVEGARPDADLLKTLRTDYPTWRFSSGTLRRQRWATTGTLAWTLDLESRRHPKVMLEVEYVRNLDTHGKPTGTWSTTEGVFNASREAGVGDGLLDAFAGDVSQRPVFVLAEEQVPTKTDGGGRPFRVSFHSPGDDAPKDRIYLQWPGDRWTKR
jgi:hypothetical protein